MLFSRFSRRQAATLLCAFFILLAAGYDIIFLRKSQKPVKVSLYLRKDPVEATYKDNKVGEIKNGTIVTDMDKPNEIGYRTLSQRQVAYLGISI